VSRVLLFSAKTGYQLRAFDDAARKLGIDLALATDRCKSLDDPWGDRAIAVKFDRPATIANLRGIDAQGVIAVGDRPAVLAAEAAEAFGLRFHSTAGTRACHDKFLARQLYEAAGLPVPAYFRARLSDDPATAVGRAIFPCVLKPLGLSASRGVIRADDERQFVAAWLRIRAILEKSEDLRVQRDPENRWLQVERYIPGREFALEGLVTESCLQVLAVFDKPDPLEGPYFEETIYVTPSRFETEAIVNAASRAVRALGLRHGPVHAEMRVNDEGVWMLETGARPIGGLCARALRFRFDGAEASLEELLLRHAVGEDVTRATLAGPASGVMMVPIPKNGIYESVEGVDRARAVRGIEDLIVTAVPGQRLRQLPEGSSYLGFIFARGDSPAAVEDALRRAHMELRFHIAAELETFT
jgi:biotin carboxylase